MQILIYGLTILRHFFTVAPIEKLEKLFQDVKFRIAPSNWFEQANTIETGAKIVKNG
jgi:hypothetical protein